MTSWLNTQISFDNRGAILTLSRHELIDYPQFKSLLDLKKTPEELEQAWRVIIKAARPNIYECSILWMDYKFDSQAWEVGVMHPGFDAVAQGCCIPREPLIEKFKNFKDMPVYRIEPLVIETADEPESWRDKPALL